MNPKPDKDIVSVAGVEDECNNTGGENQDEDDDPNDDPRAQPGPTVLLYAGLVKGQGTRTGQVQVLNVHHLSDVVLNKMVMSACFVQLENTGSQSLP